MGHALFPMEPPCQQRQAMEAVAQAEAVAPAASYDVILKCKPSDLCRDEYWEVAFPKGYEVVRKTKEGGVAIGILGNFNRGKTWIMSRLCQCDLPDQGMTMKTDGLSLKWVEVCGDPDEPDQSTFDHVVIDTAGINSPIDLLGGGNREKLEKKLGNDVNNKRLDKLLKERREERRAEDTRRKGFGEFFTRKAQESAQYEDFLQTMTLQLSNCIIVVMNETTYLDQMFLHKIVKKWLTLCTTDSSSERLRRDSDVYVIHNFLRTKDFEERDQLFTASTENLYPGQREKQGGIPQFSCTQEDFRTHHVCLMCDDYDAGRAYNNKVFGLLKRWMHSRVKRGGEQGLLHLIERFSTCAHVILTRGYLQNLKEIQPKMVDNKLRFKAIREVPEQPIKRVETVEDRLYGAMQGFEPPVSVSTYTSKSGKRVKLIYLEMAGGKPISFRDMDKVEVLSGGCVSAFSSPSPTSLPCSATVDNAVSTTVSNIDRKTFHAERDAVPELPLNNLGSLSFLQTDDDKTASDCTGAQVQVLASSECLSLYVSEQLVTCWQKDTVSAQIGVEGANLILPLYGISLTIPPEAITTTDISLSLFVSDKAVNVGGKTAYVGLIELLPHKTIFSKPVTLRYELKHHHKLGVDCFDTQFHFLYGKGIDPSESYDFAGSLNSACRHTSYESMDLDLQEDNIQLSTLSFCRYCCVVLYKRFGITISFFVRPKGVPVGEREWELRIVISCSCSENLETIQKEQEKFGFSFVDKRPLCCRELPYFGSQRLEFSLSKDDDFTSNFSLRSKQNFFSGDELRFVVESSNFRHLLISCFIKCSEQIDCTQPVMIAYKYYESSALREKLLSEDDVSVLLDSKASSHSDYSDSNSPSSRSRRRKKVLEVRGCDRSALTYTAPAAQHINGNDIAKSSLESKLVKIERKPVKLELLNISKHLSNDWKNVARRLGLEDQLIEAIENDEKANERVYQMLLKWTQSQYESATVSTLCKALIEENRLDIARKVFLQENERLE